MEIARAIEYAHINKENLEKWGKIGRKIIKEKYTWEKVARDLESYLLLIDDKVALGC
jgi:glycosyltransferase involved in cell wall biosynthesis